MEATGVSHIAICVRDMDKSLAFYRDILDMRIKKDEVQDTSQGGLPHTYKHPRKTRRTVHVAYGEGRTPFLVLTSHPGDQADGQPHQTGPSGRQPPFLHGPGRKGLGRNANFQGRATGGRDGCFR